MDTVYEWIAPKLEQRAWEAVLIVERENQGNIKEFSAQLEKIKVFLTGEGAAELSKLEAIFLEKNVAAKKAYKMGFEDALHLKASL
ncbi:hypothetical protein [Paenibacillus hunanensis]|uniref:Uncharacterized protein n=1 Tax=Paenibacillus hunanensis TaxID=539262 RepID=A0ABU1IY06_9BACL|nr:hypothetical protein [Paenibacillus hunanensis]MDR6243113.1 hypothetical protein [Paenibacillus hunanensis]GGJ11776.1 hypothetical protein GCM10008022_21110 [Paenibacillus hunanensis]